MGTAFTKFNETINSVLRYEFSNQVFFLASFLEQSLKTPNTKTNKASPKPKVRQEEEEETTVLQDIHSGDQSLLLSPPSLSLLLIK